MNVGFLLELAAEGMPDRVAVGSREGGVTYGQLLEQAQRAARVVRGTTVGGVPAERLAMLDLNSATLPVLLFGAAFAGVPFVPLNYRLADDRLRAMLRPQRRGAARRRPAGGRSASARCDGVLVATRAAFLDAQPRRGRRRDSGRCDDPTTIAVLLFTSGTTGEPKAAVLRHRHLTSYIISTVRVHGRRRGRGRAGQRAALPHRRHLGRPHRGVRAGAGSSTSRPSSPTSGSAAARRGHHPRHGRADHARPDPRRGRGDGRRRCPACATSPTAAAAMPVAVIERAMTPAAARRLRQRLRAHRDQLHGRRPRPRRPPGRLRERRPAVRARLGSVGRPLPDDRAGDPRPVRAIRCRPGSRARSGCGASRSPGEYLGRGDLDRDGWFPTNDGGWPRRRRLPVRGGPPRRRDRPGRREHLPGRDRGRPPAAPGRGRGRRRRHPRRASGARRSPPPSCCSTGPAGRPRPSCRTGSGPGCARRGPRAASQFRDRAALQRDRQAAPAGAADPGPRARRGVR